MNTIEVDRDVAVTALGIIQAYPERWEQGTWRADFSSNGTIEKFHDDPLNEGCDTAFCMAGWVAVIDKIRWAGMEDEGIYYAHNDIVAGPACTCPPEQPICTCGQNMAVRDYAMLRLGLDPEAADSLFCGDNSLTDLQIGVKALINDEDVYMAMHPDWDEDADEE